MSEPEIIGLDESFGHQLVAPRSRTLYQHERWAERGYYLLHLGDVTLNAGRQLYPNAGLWRVFAAAATSEREVCLRSAPPFTLGDDPNAPLVGPVRVEVVRPLEAMRLILDEPGFPLAYDLTFEARFPPKAHEPTLVERDGEVQTHSMSFFQSGYYSGTVALDGHEYAVDRRAGFRDRSWGMRKHDGAPGRGLVVFATAEFADRALYVLFYETASGRRPYTGGWLMTADGVVDTVAGAEHDLRFGEHWLEGGALDLEMASGNAHRLEFTTETRLFLSGVGYSPDPASKDPGQDDFDLTDPAVTARLEGQTDHGSRFLLDGEAGHGYVEIGRGTHVRYRPTPED